MRQLKITQQITNRDTASLEKYLQDIGKIDMITAEEEAVLAKEIRAGNMRALDKMVRSNLRFVVSVAKQYQNQGLTLSDLINEGNLGLIKAAQRFDETKGFKFISYAVWWIRQSIINALLEQSRLVRVPLNKQNSYSKINRAASDFVQEFQREPSKEELKDILGADVSITEIRDFLNGNKKHLSIDAPMKQDEDGSLKEMLKNEDDIPDDDLMKQSLTNEIAHVMAVLSERESEVIKYYFGIGCETKYSLEDIGEIMGLTRERVRQIKERALRRLRKTSRSQKLIQYLA